MENPGPMLSITAPEISGHPEGSGQTAPKGSPNPVSEEHLDPGKSIIVVSDLHLGSNEDPETGARFGRFLDFVKGGAMAGDLRLLTPGKFILLGDILELWDPRDQNRENTVLDALVPLSKLERLGCEIIYVTGNHDEDIGELAACLHGRGQPLCLSGTTGIRIVKRHYIPGPDMEGLESGGIHYAFLHGHQFDPEQVTNTISECLGSRFDPIGFVEDLASSSPAKVIPRRVHWELILTWIGLLIHFFLPDNPFLNPITLVFWGTVVIFLCAGMYLFGVKHREKISSSIISAACAISAVLISALLVAGRFVLWIYPGLFFSIVIVYSYIIAVVAVPRSFAFGKRAIYNWFKPGDKTIGEMLHRDFQELLQGAKPGGASPPTTSRNILFPLQYAIGRLKHAFYRMKVTWYFKPGYYSSHAEVLVFGHTHRAGYYPYHFPTILKSPKTGLSKIALVNTGCWITRNPPVLSPLAGFYRDVRHMFIHPRDARLRKGKGSSSSGYGVHEFTTDATDTFVYIDHNHIQLMKWEDDPANPPGSIRRLHSIPVLQVRR